MKKDKSHIKNAIITSRPSISKLKVNKEYDENFPEEIRKAFYKDSKNVRGRISLPKALCSHIAEIISKVNPYCCISFICHAVPKTGANLFACEFSGGVGGCGVGRRAVPLGFHYMGFGHNWLPNFLIKFQVLSRLATREPTRI